MSYPERLHPSWAPFFAPRTDLLKQILHTISGEPYNPPEELIFRFAQTDLARVRVVVLGQDPYPQPGAATGRSFEVAGLSSWQGPIRQSSLRNLMRAICRAVTGELLPWREVQARIADGRFPVLPPDRLWDALTAQGVLFLNTYLTCCQGAPLSHRRLWEPFAHDLVRYIDEVRGADASWFLWGADARRYGACVLRGRRYESRHPMMAGSEPDGFLQNPCFAETASQIDWTGVKFVSNR